MTGTHGDWSVGIYQDGRGGRVAYREPAGSLSLPWEFSGGDAVASIRVGDAAEWRQQHGWAAGRRATILERIAAEVIRRKAPGGRARIDDPPGWIHIQLGAMPPPLNARQRALRFYLARRRFMFIASLVLAAGALVACGILWSLSLRVPHGTPSGDSVRAGDEIATLIQTLETYVPSLHRDPTKDRFRLSLFLYPVDGRSAGRLVPLAKHFRAQEAGWARLLGGDGRTLWFNVNGLGGLQPATGRRIGPAELRAANPGLAETWEDPRRISFAHRLRVTLPDRTLLEIDPETLKAAPADENRAGVVRPSGPVVQDFLCAGVRPAPTEWLGLHSPREAERDYRPQSRLSRVNDAADAKEPRRLHRGELGPEQDRGFREILSITPLPGDEHLNAAFVRSGPNGEPLRLAGPDGFLMVFTSAPGLAGTLVVARVNADGALAWQVDTGIDRFKWSQVLPAPDHVALVGTRPPVPGKVPEPILVIVNTQAGTQAASTLWK